MEKLELGETYKYMVEADYTFDTVLCNHKFFIEDVEFAEFRFEENLTSFKYEGGKEIKKWKVVLYDVNHNILKECNSDDKD